MLFRSALETNTQLADLQLRAGQCLRWGTLAAESCCLVHLPAADVAATSTAVVSAAHALP